MNFKLLAYLFSERYSFIFELKHSVSQCFEKHALIKINIKEKKGHYINKCNDYNYVQEILKTIL